MGTNISPRPLPIALCELFLFNNATPPSALSLTINATCPIHIWDTLSKDAGLYIHQHAIRQEPLFEVTQTGENACTIQQNPEIHQTPDDFLVLTSGIPFTEINVHSPKAKAYIDIKANIGALNVTTGNASHLRLEDCDLTCANLCTGAKSFISLLCNAQEITTRTGIKSRVIAQKNAIARLHATAGNESIIATSSVQALTVTARPNASLLVNAHNTEHTVVQARKDSVIAVDMTGHICNFHPKLLADGTIIGTADAINIFDPSQMPPKDGGKIILHTNREPACILHNGCREPRKGVVSIVTATP